MRDWLSQTFSSSSLDIDVFQNSPIQLGRMTQLKVARSFAPANTHSLEFGVYTGGSLRTLATEFKDSSFTGFDSFKGLPEAWHRSATSTYEAGHFALKALPAMPPM